MQLQLCLVEWSCALPPGSPGKLLEQLHVIGQSCRVHPEMASAIAIKKEMSTSQIKHCEPFIHTGSEGWPYMKDDMHQIYCTAEQTRAGSVKRLIGMRRPLPV